MMRYGDARKHTHARARARWLCGLPIKPGILLTGSARPAAVSGPHTHTHAHSLSHTHTGPGPSSCATRAAPVSALSLLLSPCRRARARTHTHTHTHTHIHTPALLPSVKRQVFCIGESLKMVKHQAWATTIVASKSLGSMTTKGQMKPTFRLSLTASQVRENSQEMSPNIRSYPVF